MSEALLMTSTLGVPCVTSPWACTIRHRTAGLLRILRDRAPADDPAVSGLLFVCGVTIVIALVLTAAGLISAPRSQPENVGDVVT
jgi:hypothetical protein